MALLSFSDATAIFFSLFMFALEVREVRNYRTVYKTILSADFRAIL